MRLSAFIIGLLSLLLFDGFAAHAGNERPCKNKLTRAQRSLQISQQLSDKAIAMPGWNASADAMEPTNNQDADDEDSHNSIRKLKTPAANFSSIGLRAFLLLHSPRSHLVFQVPSSVTPRYILLRTLRV